MAKYWTFWWVALVVAACSAPQEPEGPRQPINGDAGAEDNEAPVENAVDLVVDAQGVHLNDGRLLTLPERLPTDAQNLPDPLVRALGQVAAGAGRSLRLRVAPDTPYSSLIAVMATLSQHNVWELELSTPSGATARACVADLWGANEPRRCLGGPFGGEDTPRETVVIIMSAQNDRVFFVGQSMGFADYEVPENSTERAFGLARSLQAMQANIGFPTQRVVFAPRNDEAVDVATLLLVLQSVAEVAGPALLLSTHWHDSNRIPVPGPVRSLVGTGTSREAIREVFRSHSSEISQCTGPSANGRVLVRVEIDVDGSVTDAQIEESSTGDPPLDSCVTDTIRQWQFPPSTHPTIVRYPYAFVPAPQNPTGP